MDFILFLLGMVPWPVWAVPALVAVCLISFVWGWRAALGSAFGLLTLFGAIWGRQSGAEAERAKQSRDREKLREKYDEIDRKSIDPTDSYDRLRRLSDDKD